MELLTLESTPEEIQKRINELRDFGYEHPKALVELEMIEGIVMKETGVPSFEEREGRVWIATIADILDELEVSGTCWQSAVEEMIFVLVTRQRRDIIEKLLGAREWNKYIYNLLFEIWKFINGEWLTQVK